MKYFSKEYLDFFKELEDNNSKEWFDENRNRYEEYIKIPFKEFARDLIVELQKEFSTIDISDKHNIGKINRDIRFGKDKTPYKTNMSLKVMPKGKQDNTYPGLLLQVGHKEIRGYSGLHGLDAKQLLQVREYIANHKSSFSKIIKTKKFVDSYNEIHGEKHKRLSPELKEPANEEPLIFNKEFYWYFCIDASEILKDGLTTEILSKYKDASEVREFFINSLL